MSPGCYGSCYLGSNVRFSLVFTTSDKNPPHNRQVRSVCSAQFLNHLPSTIFTEKKFQNKQCSWGANENRAKSSLFNLLRFLNSIPNWPTLSKKKAPSNSYVNCCLSADLQLNCRMLWDRSLQKEEQTLG